MSSAYLKLGLCLVVAAVCVRCGAPGIPEPPSLELARPVRDLTAVRKGNEVHLTWSVPTETTDHQAFRHAGGTQICRTFGAAIHQCGTPISELPTPINRAKVPRRLHKNTGSQQPALPQASYIDHLSSSLETQSPIEDLVYAVNVLNSYGKSAGLSNLATVPSAPTLPYPTALAAQLTAEGVRLTWNPVPSPEPIAGIQYSYRVYRRDVQTKKDSIAGELPVTDEPKPTLLDKSFAWEKTYEYRVTVATIIQQASRTEQVEGDDSPSVRLVAHDVFPPATPTGLQAVFSGPGQKPFIDLVWKANTESDLAGYNVYRRESGAERKINTELVKEPAFRDADVVPGHEYFYSISAVDVRGNESPRSEEASETVPDQ